jgi:anti-sigma regulatory factor (Ser/Thr protein kinase)
LEDATAVDARGLRHAALLYRTQDELAGPVTEFVEAGVRARDAVLVTSAAPVLPALRAMLDGHGEQVAWADLASIGSNPRRLTSVLRSFAAENRGRPVRLVEVAGVHFRDPAQERELIRHDALLNLAFRGEAVTVLCGYELTVPRAVLAAVSRTHPAVIRGGRAEPNPSFQADALVPDECDQPLGDPPPDAVRLGYRRDQAEVRRVVGGCARAAGLRPDRATDLVIAVGELAANTLAHTSGPGTLSIWLAAGDIICQVHDSGQIRDPLAGSLRPSPASPVRGRGLWVVHQLCDLVETRTGSAGTTTRVRMRLPA